jgi:hypothetical protein
MEKENSKLGIHKDADISKIDLLNNMLGLVGVGSFHLPVISR